MEPFPDTCLVTQRRFWLVHPDRTLELDAFQRFREWLRERVD